MQGEPPPLVSICIPTFNDASVVKDALSSALRQQYSPLEILVIDNHSSDDTWRIANDLANGDSRVRLVRHNDNIGMAMNFNACIRAAKGKFILILCADDILHPDCTRALAGALNEDSNLVLAACGRLAIDQSLRQIGTLPTRTRTEKISGASLARECFAHGNRIGEPSAVMFQRDLALRGFSPAYSQALDLEMWFHLLGQGSAILLAKPLCSIRHHALQTTHANIASGRIVKDKRLLFREYVERLEGALTPWDKLLWDARMASSAGRTFAAGGSVDSPEIAEVFYKTIFAQFFWPAALVLWKLAGWFSHPKNQA
jgi:hypothetical protein